jgi:putative endopeptidase
MSTLAPKAKRLGFLAGFAAVSLIALSAALPSRAADDSAAHGFDTGSLDKSVSPCDDFYRYACGSWIDHNPVPSDQASWSQFNVLAEKNRARVHELLEEAVAHPTAETRKIADFYGACMDEKGAEAAGSAPLSQTLNRINAISSKEELPPLIADLHRMGVNVLFGFGSSQDPKDATRVIAIADQGGLGLPDRDYYFKDDKKSVETRAAYLTHVTKIFELLGDAPANAAAEAKTVMGIETALAKPALNKVDRRDPQKVYHKFTPKQLIALDPAFGWQAYFDTVNAPSVATMNVTEPAFFKAQSALLKKTSLDDLKTYLRWQAAHDAAPVLSKAFVDENFSFYGHFLNGSKELQVRWKRCVTRTDQALGEDAGRAYVAKYFGGESKEKNLAMIKEVLAAYREDLKSLDWMEPATKTKALEKLDAIAVKIGYPDRWRDYSALEIRPGDAYGNVTRAAAFEFKRQLDKIGQPVDRGEWGMTPPTVNAYYDPQMNDINFPAGILETPFFNPGADDPINFGAIGLVMGHEMTHGFDDEGRQFDAHGNLEDWWTKEDAKKFEAKSQCLVDEYGGFTAVDDVKVNGKLTLGENTADNGGARLAYAALMARLHKAEGKSVDGFTPEQRFFLGFAQVWCSNRTPENARLRALTDPHSPPQFRVNGTVSNMPEFATAFSCKAGDKMVRKEACKVW